MHNCSDQEVGQVAQRSPELVYDPFDDLPLSRSPAMVGFRPRPLGVVFGSGRYQRSIEIQPATLPLNTRKALVGQVGIVKVLDDEKVCYGRSSEAASASPKAQITPSGLTESATLKP